MEQDPRNEAPAVLNLDELLTRCMNNMDFVHRVLDKFHTHFDEDLDQLEQALRAADPETVGRVAHRLKGASANVAARGLHAQVAGIEELARGNRLAEIPPRLELLRQEWSRFVDSTSSLSLRSLAGTSPQAQANPP